MRGNGEPARVLRALHGEPPMLRPRLAWSPWSRGLLLGLALGALVGLVSGALLVLSVVEARVSGMERRFIPPKEVFDHGGGQGKAVLGD